MSVNGDISSANGLCREGRRHGSGRLATAIVGNKTGSNGGTLSPRQNSIGLLTGMGTICVFEEE